MSLSHAWEGDFPVGFGHTSIAYLKRCPGYEDAKKGDMDSARFVVSRCVKGKRLNELREQYPYGVLLPVLGRNCLPLALAQEIELPVWFGVRLLQTISRKSLSAIQRLIHKPVFSGYIQKDLDYIIVDDVITQGGTVAALREFVMIHGGKVVAVVALAYAIGSHNVAPIKRHIARLMLKFGSALITLLNKLGVITVIRELTNSQVRYLLRFASVSNMVVKLRSIGRCVAM